MSVKEKVRGGEGQLEERGREERQKGREGKGEREKEEGRRETGREGEMGRRKEERRQRGEGRERRRRGGGEDGRRREVSKSTTKIAESRTGRITREVIPGLSFSSKAGLTSFSLCLNEIAD